MKIKSCTYIISLTLTLLNMSCVDKVYEPRQHRKVYLTPADKKVEATVVTRKRVNTRTSCNYYWYDNMKINFTKGGYSGHLLDGPYSEYSYPSETLLQKGNFKLGLKHGRWLKWHSNGELAEISSWRHGKLHGERQIFNDSGIATTKEEYRHGVLKKMPPDSANKKRIFKNGLRFAKNIFNRRDSKDSLNSPSEIKKNATLMESKQ